MPAQRTSRQVTKSVRFTAEETALIEAVSQREHLSEGTLMRKLVLDGVAQLRLNQAINDYAAGELNLGDGARQAGVSLRRFMAELERQGVELVDDQHLAASLETLVDRCGGSPALQETIAALRGREG